MTKPRLTRPSPPKFPRGGVRPPSPEQVEDEATVRGALFEGDWPALAALHSVTFAGCVFRGVNLTGSAWARVRLQDVRFEDCDLSGARWHNVSLERVEVTGSRLLGLQAAGVHLRHVRMTRVHAPLSVWQRADAAHLYLSGCDLSEASAMEARLPGAVLRDCRLHRTDLRGATLDGADLRGSALTGVRAGPADLQGVTVEAAQVLDLAHLLGVTVADWPGDGEAAGPL